MSIMASNIGIATVPYPNNVHYPHEGKAMPLYFVGRCIK